MNERISELGNQAWDYALYHETVNGKAAFNSFINKNFSDLLLEKFAELIVEECAGLIHLECKDFANGNCFHDDALWKSVTTEYGKNKERGFDPVGMSIHFDKLLKKHFGVEE